MSLFLGEEKMKTRYNERMVKLEFVSQNYPFWAYIKKNSTRSLFGAWSVLLVHVRFTPSEGPKGFCKLISKEIGP